MIGKAQRRIVCAACKDPVSGRIVIGPRHFDTTMRTFITNEDDYSKFTDQGFIDQFGEYSNRQEAWVIATAANQIFRRVGGDESKGGTLYSENLY